MYGYPRTIQTRHDVEYLIGYLGSDWASDENRAKGLEFLRGLIDNRQSYAFDRTLPEGEEPDGPAPEYIVLTDEDGARRQERLTDDPAAMIHRLGYAVAEVEKLIATVEGAQ